MERVDPGRIAENRERVGIMLDSLRFRAAEDHDHHGPHACHVCGGVNPKALKPRVRHLTAVG